MSAATADMARFAQATPHAAADVSVGRVRMFSTTAWMAYRRDEAEWQRRGTAPPIVALDVLNALMDLPAGVAVPVSSLSDRHRRHFAKLPVGALGWTTHSVTRRVVTPVVPVLAMIRAGVWLDGLRAASRFSAYCPRMVIVPQLPDLQIFGVPKQNHPGEQAAHLPTLDDYVDRADPNPAITFTVQASFDANRDSCPGPALCTSPPSPHSAGTTSSGRSWTSTLINKEANTKRAAAQLGHATEQVTKKHYIEESTIAPDSSDILEQLGGGRTPPNRNAVIMGRARPRSRARTAGQQQAFPNLTARGRYRGVPGGQFKAA